jgi:hypothetical protein
MGVSIWKNTPSVWLASKQINELEREALKFQEFYQ